MSLESHEPPSIAAPSDAPERAVEVAEFYSPPPDAQHDRRTARREAGERRRRWLSIILFCVTTFSVFVTGIFLGSGLWTPFYALLEDGRLLIPNWPMLVNGLTFAAGVMSILLAHEMGHYLQTKRYGVWATPPFFLPFPFSPFGTLGAVIVQDGGRANRKQLFDIAISGPLAGLVVAIPILWYGVSISRFAFLEGPEPGEPWVLYSDPLLIRWIVEVIHGPYGPGQDIVMNAPLFAGWVGIFITALNLLPLGQLDGGHILYTMIGKPAHYIAYAVMVGALGWMTYQRRFDYALIVVLLLIFGVKHPPTADDKIPLGWSRYLLGAITLSFIIIGFTPTPILQLIPYVPVSR